MIKKLSVKFPKKHNYKTSPKENIMDWEKKIKY